MIRLLALTAAASLQAPLLAQLSIVTNLPATYIDIAATGTPLPMNSSGETTIQTTIGNALLPAGNVRVGANGGIRFRGTFLEFTFGSEPIPNLGAFWGEQTLLPFWAFLDPAFGNGGTIYWEEVGDRLIIQWEDVAMGFVTPTVPRVTFQVQVPASGPVWAQYVYEVMGPGIASGSSATIGYQAGSWGNDVLFSMDQPGAVGSSDVLSLVGNVLASPPNVEHRFGPLPAPTSTLDFDSPQLPLGTIARDDPAFIAAGIASIDLIGTWNDQGDILSAFASSNVDGRALVSDQGVLTVAELFDPLDTGAFQAGMDFRFVEPIDRFGMVFVDQREVNYTAELFSGGTSLGTQIFKFDGDLAPADVWLRSGTGRSFDRITLTNTNGSSGWGIDRIALGAPGIFTRPVCEAELNSRLKVGNISAEGSDQAASNSLRLVADQLPANALGYFLTSRTPGSFMPASSRGRICLGGLIGRFSRPNQIMNSGALGTIELDIDLTDHPTPNGPTMVMPGETWYYQLWHRDSFGFTTTPNFTNSMAITFQ